jgi:phosphopantetheinyl transferase (holo-ACP synthase)
VHRETSTRVVHTITLKQTNAAASRATKILVEFAAKEAAAKKLMADERRAARELEEKAACDAGYPAWQAYWQWRREEA